MEERTGGMGTGSEGETEGNINHIRDI